MENSCAFDILETKRQRLELSTRKILFRGGSLKVAILASAADIEVIQELLSPWNISFTNSNEADIVICRKEKPSETKKTLVVPSESTNIAKTTGRDKKSKAIPKAKKPISVAAGPKTTLTITPHVFFSDSLMGPEKENSISIVRRDHGDSATLAFDVVNEYYRIIGAVLDAESSSAYRLLTGLPIPYTRAPKQLKNLIMRKKEHLRNLTLYDKLSLDALRFILAGAIKRLTRKKLDKRTWDGKNHAILLTHDIETRKGLLAALRLKKIENRYDLPAAWYIPARLFKLDSQIVQELANHGEVGSHDTKHDGKLDRTPASRLVARLVESREVLEAILSARVEGFRAPLLQHSSRIIHALGKAGYSYDTSIPTWEPKHPKTMKPHGIATVYPLTIEGFTEIPVTLPQDHQLLDVLGLNPTEVLAEWSRNLNTIREMGGLGTFLIHPDYDLAKPENMSIYEELLNQIASDTEALVDLPINIARREHA